ncbi:hypothetical protein [Nocardioides sp. zg-DK7169]|uniref:hypothetical protein n=1 Tax=Nocardioides sp. zg-DK7169 TaxID=2736600 RepID=UPI0015546EB4|nr:hypothetical protein [Nocardioides sp. zg-DK7169]NPC97417.1 hypothetical protein [Nocardioides sp. zg-DK7169]
MSKDEVDLGPKPDPVIEPGEPNPGGADALPEERSAVPADLTLEANPAVDTDSAPDTLQEGEDTSTEATRDEEPTPAEEESPA